MRAGAGTTVAPGGTSSATTAPAVEPTTAEQPGKEEEVDPQQKTLTATTQGPDAGGYTAPDATAFNFVDISGAGGASVLSGLDDGAVALSLPFTLSLGLRSGGPLCLA